MNIYFLPIPMKILHVNFLTEIEITRKQGVFLRAFLSYCTTLLLCVSLISCGASKPELQLLVGSDSVSVGDRAYVQWKFSKADSVKVAEVPGNFNAVDLCYSKPTATTTYHVTGFLGTEQVSGSWTVRVIGNEKSGDQTLSEKPKEQVPTENTENSVEKPSEKLAEKSVHHSVEEKRAEEKQTPKEEKNWDKTAFAEKETPKKKVGDGSEKIYLSGLSSLASPSSVRGGALKIVRSSFDVVHAVLLDAQGNFIPGFGANPAVWSLSAECSSPSNRQPEVSVSEYVSTGTSQSSLVLCADYAGYMKSRLPLIENAYDVFFRSLSPADEVTFLPFDHRSKNSSLQGLRASDARKLFAPGEITSLGGQSGMFPAAYKAVKALEKSERPVKSVVLVSGGFDNASIQTTMNDVVQAAKSAGVAFYTLAVGSNVDTYSLRYLAESTGGLFYAVPEDSEDEIRLILREIAYLHKIYYRFDFETLWKTANCSPASVALSYISSEKEEIQDAKTFNIPEKTHYPEFFPVLATFKKNAVEIEPSYDSQFSELADLLKDNPSHVVELIAHSNEEGNVSDELKLTQKRAQSARQKLVQLGVSPAQIRTRAMGGQKPVYFMHAEEWQETANRRVEMRWLDPALTPFEILAEAVQTEDQAISLSEKWEERGFKAYFEPYIVDRRPVYRVKLWGFDTYESAATAKNILQKRFGVTLTVQ